MTTTSIAGNAVGSENWRSLEMPAGDADRLLLSVVRPWLSGGAAGSWFIDRDEAALSFRIRGAADADVAALRELIESSGPGGVAAERAYLPDTARCGGPHGVEVCE